MEYIHHNHSLFSENNAICKIKIDSSMITRDQAEASKVSKNLEDLGYDGAHI